MSVVFHFMLPGDRLMEFNAGTVLHLFPGQVDMDMQRAPCGISQSKGRDQYLASGEDDACSHDDVADGPVLIIKIEILDRSDICIDGSEGIPAEIFCPAQAHYFTS